MPETLLSEATIHLFGRAVKGIALTSDDDGKSLIAGFTRGDTQEIARIYAFAFQNEYFELASPALFLVSVKGEPVQKNLDLTGLSRIPDELNTDLTVWRVRREDLTIRLDVMTGTYSRVLLDYELAENGLQDFVRGGSQLGTPTAVSSRSRRPRGWRSDDE